MITNKLQWRRQFLVTRAPVHELESWHRSALGECHVYSHPDVAVTAASSRGRDLMLLGSIFDAAQPERGNNEILQELARGIDSFDDLVLALKPYAGRYALLCHDAGNLRALQDALSLREVYYCTEPNVVVCGSQPGLLRHFSRPKLERTQDPETLKFFESDMKQVRNRSLWVGDGTLFAGVRHLLPNHYFDAQTLNAKRYWPNQPWQTLDLDDTVDRACRFLQGILKAVAHRHRMMIAVTAGTDSRTLLAASRDIRHQVYYFINKEPGMTDQSRDIRVPTSMCKRVCVPFHIHDVSGAVDPEFRRVFLDNTFFASDRILSTIYNVYYKQHQDKVNLLGVGEIGRALWGAEPKELDGYFLAYTLRYKRSSYAARACESWLREAKPVAGKYRIDLLTLLLWEQLLGNWGAVGNSESDIAIEEFDPYDSHYMYETLLAVDEKSINGDRHVIFRAMIQKMWPELLPFPINPPDTPTERMKRLSRQIGMFPLLKRLRYDWNRRQFAKSSRGSATTPAPS